MRPLHPLSVIAIWVVAAGPAIAGCSGSSGSSPSSTTAPTVITSPSSSPASALPTSTQTELSAPTSAPATTAVPNPPTTAIAACPTSSLRLDIGPGGAAAGTDYLPLVFTNTGPSACSLRGFPGASFVGAGGQQIGRPASRSPGEPVRRVVIAPGGKAHALLGIPDPANYSASDCRPQRASGIRVYPPDQTESLVASAHVTVCTTNNGRPLVQPIRPGMRG